MGRRVKETIKKVNKVTEIVGSHHTGAYAAQAAYFFVLSMIPIILLLLTAVQFTPATYANVIDAVEQVFPTSVQGFIRSIVTQVYFSQSAKIIPITILVALWSAGRPRQPRRQRALQPRRGRKAHRRGRFGRAGTPRRRV